MREIERDIEILDRKDVQTMGRDVHDFCVWNLDWSILTPGRRPC